MKETRADSGSDRPGIESLKERGLDGLRGGWGGWSERERDRDRNRDRDRERESEREGTETGQVV